MLRRMLMASGSVVVLPVTFVAASSNNVDSGSSGAQTLVVNAPVGITAGDFLVFCCLGSDNFSITPTISMTTFLNFTSANKMYVFGRTAIVGEPSTYTFSFNAAAPKVGISCVAYRNANTVSVIGTPAAGSVAGSITALANGKLVSMFANESFSTTSSITAATASTVRINTPNRRYAHVGVADRDITPGASGTTTGTWSNTPTAPFAVQMIVN